MRETLDFSVHLHWKWKDLGISSLYGLVHKLEIRLPEPKTVLARGCVVEYQITFFTHLWEIVIVKEESYFLQSLLMQKSQNRLCFLNPFHWKAFYATLHCVYKHFKRPLCGPKLQKRTPREV